MRVHDLGHHRRLHLPVFLLGVYFIVAAIRNRMKAKRDCTARAEDF